MKRFLTTTSAAALGCAVPFLASAQEVIVLEDIILSANQTPVAESKAGVTVEVVDEEELREDGTQQVSDKLNTLPGVTIGGNGGVGAVQLMFVRGREAKYVPVYFDGIDMSDPTGPQTLFNFGGFLNSNVGRVEILKGSQSALYGSEAVGGVVNMTSPRLAENGQELRFSAEFGSYNTKSANFQYLQKTDRADLSFSLTRLTTDGFSSADENDGNTEADPSNITSMTVSGDFQATDALTLGATVIVEKKTFNIDAFGGAGGDADRPNTADELGARVYASYDAGLIEHTLTFTYRDIERKDFGGFSQLFHGVRKEIAYSGVAELDVATVSFGAEHSIEEATVDSAFNEYDTTSIWAEGQFALSPDIDMSVSARAEDHSAFGSHLTGRAALAYRPAENTTVRASIGSGFRAPSLYELYGPFGNAALQPEESWSVDLGVEQKYASGAEAKATLFYSEIDNLIGFAGGGYSQVPGTTVSKGLELSGAIPLNDRISLSASYTYTDSKTAAGTQLVRVPKHDLVLGVDAEITDRLKASFTINHVADRAPDGFPSTPMADYTVANATFTFDVSDTTEAYVRIVNIFDEEYQQVAGYGTSDRAAYFGIRASF